MKNNNARYASAGETSCDARSCIYALTYQVTDNTARFEMTAAASWVAVGFSSDEKMVSSTSCCNFCCVNFDLTFCLIVKRFAYRKKNIQPGAAIKWNEKLISQNTRVAGVFPSLSSETSSNGEIIQCNHNRPTSLNRTSNRQSNGELKLLHCLHVTNAKQTVKMFYLNLQ